MKRLKIKYVIDNDNMTDDEYDSQKEREFIISVNMIRNLILQNDNRIGNFDSIEIEDISMI